MCPGSIPEALVRSQQVPQLPLNSKYSVAIQLHSTWKNILNTNVSRRNPVFSTAIGTSGSHEQKLIINICSSFALTLLGIGLIARLQLDIRGNNHLEETNTKCVIKYSTHTPEV